MAIVKALDAQSLYRLGLALEVAHGQRQTVRLGQFRQDPRQALAQVVDGERRRGDSGGQVLGQGDLVAARTHLVGRPGFQQAGRAHGRSAYPAGTSARGRTGVPDPMGGLIASIMADTTKSATSVPGAQSRMKDRLASSIASTSDTREAPAMQPV
jgi:hypothetical protein